MRIEEYLLLYLEIGEGGSPHAEQTSGRWYAWTRGSTYARISSDGDSVVRQACGRATLGIFMYNVQLLFTAIARLQTIRSSSPRLHNPDERCKLSRNNIL